MSLDVIQSYFVNTQTDNYTRTNTTLVSHQAMLSCKFLKKHGYTTVLYTSKDLVTHFQNHPYDDILTIDSSELGYVTKNHFWSGTKLVCCEKHPNPYVHIDLDVFLIEDIIRDHTSNNFIFFHEEPWMISSLNLDIPLCDKLFGIKPTVSYNAAIMGGKNQNLLQQHLQKILNLVKNQSDDIKVALKDNLESKQNSNWAFSVLIEQLLFPNSLPNVHVLLDTKECQNHTSVMPVLKKNNILHLWYAKPFFNETIGIERLMQYMTRYYFG